jgi:transposase
MIKSYYDARDLLEGSAMRGADEQPDHLFTYISLEQRIPADHPLRPVRQMTNAALRAISGDLDAVYSDIGRPSIPPEQLLRALLLQVLYTIRSERLLIEQLDYNLLFRWFVGLRMDDPVWDHSVFSKNRDRLLAGDVAMAFLQAIRAQAEAAGLLSDEHFTVDGTLLEAWASHKSLRPREDTPPAPPPDDDPHNPSVNFRGERRRNTTHRSTTDPQARLYRKAAGQPAKLAYLGHVITDNRHGLIVDTETTLATGTAERDAARAMVRDLPPGRHRTLGADKNYDTHDCVAMLREHGVTPHVAQNDTNRRSAIDARTTRHPGYQVSQQKRKLVEQGFGWMKTVGTLRKLRHRGVALARWTFTFNAAGYDVVRMRTLLFGSG